MLFIRSALLTGILSAAAWAQQSSPVMPQTEVKSELITNLTLEKAQEIIEEMGFKSTRERDEKGQLNSYFIYKADDFKVAVEVSPGFVWLYNIFTESATPETLDEWNQKNRFCKAYKAVDYGVYLDTEIIVEGGITRANLEAQIEEFRNSLAKWARFLITHQDPLAQTAKQQ